MFKSTKVTAVTHLGDDLREWLIVGRLLGKVFYYIIIRALVDKHSV